MGQSAHRPIRAEMKQIYGEGAEWGRIGEALWGVCQFQGQIGFLFISRRICTHGNDLNANFSHSQGKDDGSSLVQLICTGHVLHLKVHMERMDGSSPCVGRTSIILKTEKLMDGLP